MKILPFHMQPTAGAYTPQTEAISPTLPEPTIQEDAAFRVTKDELLQQIGKVDREIAKREGEITTRRKKLRALCTNEDDKPGVRKPLEVKRPVEEQSQLKHQSPAQKIYAENRVSTVNVILKKNQRLSWRIELE